MFRSVTQFVTAATRDGALHIDGFGDFEIVAFWLLPIVVGGLVLVVVGAHRSRWREREPDPPTPAPARS